jgi:hypothetical protein
LRGGQTQRFQRVARQHQKCQHRQRVGKARVSGQPRRPLHVAAPQREQQAREQQQAEDVERQLEAEIEAALEQPPVERRRTLPPRTECSKTSRARARRGQAWRAASAWVAARVNADPHGH